MSMFTEIKISKAIQYLKNPDPHKFELDNAI